MADFIEDTDDFRDEDMLVVSADDLEQAQLKPKINFDLLLPKPKNMKLTETEQDELSAIQAAFIILGPAAGAVLVCPGNQIGVPEDQKCAYAAKCPLLKAKKAPAGSLCPIERTLTEQRFTAWCNRIGQEPSELTEDARVTVSDLVWLDIQEQRCLNILSTGEASRLTQLNVTEAINFTSGYGENITQEVLPLTWERVLHVNTERLDMIQEKRRQILKDWMLTPEQQWKIEKAQGKAKGNDIGSMQSSLGDKLRLLDPVFD